MGVRVKKDSLDYATETLIESEVLDNTFPRIMASANQEARHAGSCS
jgi:hypothetical protein